MALLGLTVFSSREALGPDPDPHVPPPTFLSPLQGAFRVNQLPPRALALARGLLGLMAAPPPAPIRGGQPGIDHSCWPMWCGIT